MKTADKGEVNYCILQATYMYATKLEEKNSGFYEIGQGNCYYLL